MTKFERYKQVQEECDRLKEICEGFRFPIYNRDYFGEIVDNYLRDHKTTILKECALTLLKYRDQLLIEAEQELETILKHIKDIKDVSGDSKDKQE